MTRLRVGGGASAVLCALASLVSGQEMRSGSQFELEFELGLLDRGQGIQIRDWSRTVLYSAKGTGKVYVHALSKDFDLSLRVEDADGEAIVEDDNSGGGTTPFVVVDVKEGQSIRITVTSGKETALERNSNPKGARATLKLFLARETEEALAAERRAELDVKRAERFEKDGDWEEARSVLRGAIDDLLATVGAVESSAVDQATLLLVQLGDYPQARELQEAVLEFLSRALSPEHPDIQFAKRDLANILSAEGDSLAVRELRAGVLEVFSRTLHEEHSDLQAARANFASSLFAAGDYRGARELLEEVLGVYSRTLPEDHANLQVVKRNLASILFALGEHQEARRLLETILRVYSRSLPDDHPDVQEARGNLASNFASEGDLRRARELQEKVLEVYSRTLPDDHFDVQVARGNLSCTLFSEGDLPGARRLQEQVLEVYSRRLSEDHPKVLRARGNLASILFVEGNLVKARILQEAVLKAYSRILPSEHPDLQNARAKLASTLSGYGEFDRAREMQELVLRTYSRTLPKDHPKLLRARSNLAYTLSNQGYLCRARQLQENVLEALVRTLPKDHPDLQLARSNLAYTLFVQGDVLRAKQLQETTLEVYSRILPGDHPHLQLARSSAAVICASLGDYPQAKRLRDRAAEIHSRTLPESHPDVQRNKANRAASEADQGDFRRARELLESVLEVYSRTLPEEHLDYQKARANLAVVLFQQGYVDGAIELLEKVLEVFRRSVPENYPELVRARMNLILCLARTGETARLDEMLRELAHGIIARLTSCWKNSSFRELEEMAANRSWVSDAVLSLMDSPASSAAAFSLVEVQRASTVISRRLGQLETNGGVDPRTYQLRRELEKKQIELRRSTPGRHRRLVAPEETQEFLEALYEKERAEAKLHGRLREKMDSEDFLPRYDQASIGAALSKDERGIGFWRYFRHELDERSRDFRPGVPNYLAWVVHPDGSLFRIELGPAKIIDQAIARWRAAILPERESGPSPDGDLLAKGNSRGVTKIVSLDSSGDAMAPRSAGEVLRGLVFDPILREVGDARRFVIALDDALHLVPLSALPLDGGAELVGDQYEIVVRNTLKEITIGRKGPLASPSLLALGGIDYDTEPVPFGEVQHRWMVKDDDRTERTGLSTSSKPLSKATQGAPVSLLRDSGWHRNFVALPGTLLEIESIARHFREGPGRGETSHCVSLEGAFATRDALASLGPGSRYVHLASHGYFAPESVPSMKDDRTLDWQLDLRMASDLRSAVRGHVPMMLCGLGFAGANLDPDEIGAVDGVMTGDEICELNLRRCELVVLSACETNVGVRRTGQGIASLQQALFAAGARASISSLWKVPDKATRELMTDFYRRIWIEGKPKRRALWEAQMAIRNKLNDQGRPIYSVRDWAAWVFVGDG